MTEKLDDMTSVELHNWRNKIVATPADAGEQKMKISQDLISGFGSAVLALGNEGDDRRADWSAPYEYLKGQLSRFQPVGDNIADRLRSCGDVCAG